MYHTTDPFTVFKSIKSADRQNLFCSGTSYDGFWSSNIVNGMVGHTVFCFLWQIPFYGEQVFKCDRLLDLYILWGIVKQTLKIVPFLLLYIRIKKNWMTGAQAAWYITRYNCHLCHQKKNTVNGIGRQNWYTYIIHFLGRESFASREMEADLSAFFCPAIKCVATM